MGGGNHDLDGGFWRLTTGPSSPEVIGADGGTDIILW